MLARFHALTLHDLVASNYDHAAALFDFGIAFYEHPDRTLEEVCRQRRVSVAAVVRRIEQLYEQHNPQRDDLSDYPVRLVVAYLKHTHRDFIRQRLPYLNQLIAHLDPTRFPSPAAGRDLQWVFPMFYEDFIRHIREEEDELFGYILRLDDAHIRLRHVAELYYLMERYDLRAEAQHHLEDDDEMHGIRELTSHYELPTDADLHARVIYAELQSFEKELHRHAGIENDILFPKALRLEADVRDLMRTKIALN